MTPVEVLSQVPLFAPLPDEVRQHLADVADELRLPAGDILFRQGDVGGELYVVLSGVLEVSRGELVLDLLRPPGFLGEMALLDAAPRSATVKALEDTLLLSVGSDAFSDLVHSQPQVALELLAVMARRLRRSTDQSASLVQQDVYQRLVGKLRELAETHGVPHARGVELPLPLNEELLAKTIGAEAAGVRILMELLVFDGVLEQWGEHWFIHDVQGLSNDRRDSLMNHSMAWK